MVWTHKWDKYSIAQTSRLHPQLQNRNVRLRAIDALTAEWDPVQHSGKIVNNIKDDGSNGPKRKVFRNVGVVYKHKKQRKSREPKSSVGSLIIFSVLDTKTKNKKSPPAGIWHRRHNAAPAAEHLPFLVVGTSVMVGCFRRTCSPLECHTLATGHRHLVRQPRRRRQRRYVTKL